MAYPEMFGIARVQVVMQHASGLPEDAFVNNFYFDYSDGTGSLTAEGQSAAMTRMLDAFYSGVFGTNTTAINDYLSDQITGVTYRVYDLDEATPRYPVVDPIAASWVGQGAANIPHEVALVLSFKSGPGPRRRGRIYLGPLGGFTGNNASGEWRPDPIFRQVVADAAVDLLNSTEDPVWTQVSPTAAGDVDDPWNGHSPVVEGFVDDAWDTQRSRGLAPTTRTSWDTAGTS